MPPSLHSPWTTPSVAFSHSGDRGKHEGLPGSPAAAPGGSSTRPQPATPPSATLHRVLGPFTLWGLGVGYVISGEYFGWNLGLPVAGSLGMLAAFALVTAMYAAFVFSYLELACALPRAGGAFVYAVRGLGPGAGFLAGIAQAVEFVLAPPAIAMAIGSYVATLAPAVGQRPAALVVLALFTVVNVVGVRQAALLEFAVTLLAVGELVLFAGLALPHFRWEAFAANGLPHGVGGVFAGIPFAIWFYLAIEGVANAAEETRDPHRDIPRGFGAALVTLVVLSVVVLFGAVGVGGWERVVYAPADLVAGVEGGVVPRAGAPLSDNPLPLALGQFVAAGHPLFSLLVGMGVLGLVASLNGIILAAGRGLLEMGRAGYLPRVLGWIAPATGTPVVALLTTFVIGAAAVVALDTTLLITLSAFGAVTLMIVSMVALLRLRVTEPDLPRPWRAPGAPWVPLAALGLATMSLVAMGWSNRGDAATWWRSGTAQYTLVMTVAGIAWWTVLRRRIDPHAVADAHHVDPHVPHTPPPRP